MKKGIKILLIASAIFGFGLTSLSANPLDNKTAVGAYLTGNVDDAPYSYGLQFEKQLSPKFSLGLLGAAFYNDWSDDYNTNVNLELKYTMIESRFGEHFGSRFYAYAMGGYNGWSTTSSDGNGNRTTKYYNDAVVSLGFGLEFLLIDHLSLPMNFGFAGRFPSDPSAGFCLGTGVRYSF